MRSGNSRQLIGFLQAPVRVQVAAVLYTLLMECCRPVSNRCVCKGPIGGVAWLKGPSSMTERTSIGTWAVPHSGIFRAAHSTRIINCGGRLGSARVTLGLRQDGGFFVVTGRLISLFVLTKAIVFLDCLRFL
ncbi:hypothetical protein AVEN_263640-1 [Araneus ventricosus]|uniref:Uncharacterized protein n=1 Tax=Araneus ventricosus TaxID=182803 RepID=A0A4Y2ARG8_ARAVE|nr:hypothetical protein AVEN_263640-1 [Araneus ventricosus]